MGYSRKTKTKEDCGIETTLNIISGKWKAMLLSGLLQGPIRPSEVLRKEPELNRKVLLQQLKELEMDGIVEKKIYAEIPPKVEYYLTDLGKSLEPILKHLSVWGDQFLAKK